MPNLPALTHIGICVRNIEASAAFYRKYASLDVISLRQEKDMRVAWLGNPSVIDRFIVVLLEVNFEQGQNASFHHIGLQVDSKEEVDRLAGLAEEEGILTSPPKEHGPVAGYLCIIDDPDGNGVEFSYGQEVLETLARQEN